jgi:hypothetical protein
MIERERRAQGWSTANEAWILLLQVARPAIILIPAVGDKP